MKPLLFLAALAPLPALAQDKPRLAAANAPIGSVCDIRIDDAPLDGANPFDPDLIALDVTFTSRTNKSITLPAFWYRPFSRRLQKTGEGGSAREQEVLEAQGEGEWRVRWKPQESGQHRVRLTLRRAGRPPVETASTLMVVARGKRPAAVGGWEGGVARVNPRNPRYLQTEGGRPLPLLGENLCWHGPRGTYDYDDWLAGYQKAGMNYARLWMWNNSFGAEFLGPERGNYNQERLWRLDYVLEKARRQNVAVMLCLDYHGIFQTKPDMWGTNDWWTRHAYHKSQGGPLDQPNDFFTNDEAQVLYRKRLRYLVARYAAFPNLLSWQFFNEINNVYGDASKTREANRDAQKLHPPDVVAWHERNGAHLRSIDPYRHLITTSFGSAGEQPEMWKLPAMDYANWHWYGNWSGRSRGVLGMARDVGSRFPASYGKPVSISEFGTDGTGPSTESDPHRRGLRQAIWGGIFAGTAGTAAPWWWERNHADNLYPLWGSLRAFLPADFGSANWAPRPVEAPAFKTELGEAEANGAAFDEKINLVGTWGDKPDGPAIINRPGEGDTATLNGFVHGTAKPDLRAPWVVQAHLKEGARLVLHLNSVSNDAILVVKQNGREVFRRELPNKDGGYERNNEYNEDIAIPLAAGRSEIAVENPGGDWIALDAARLEGVLPASTRAGSVPLEALATGDGTSTLVWAVDAAYAWPRGRNSPPRLVREAFVSLPQVPPGAYTVQWWSPAQGRAQGTARVNAPGGPLRLALPPFEEEIAARITRAR